MTMSNMNAPSRPSLRHSGATPGRQIAVDQAGSELQPRLDRIGGREVPPRAYVFEAAAAAKL